MTEPILLNVKQVSALTGLSRATIYKHMAEQTFPRPMKISPGAVRWRRGDILDWINSLEAA